MRSFLVLVCCVSCAKPAPPAPPIAAPAPEPAPPAAPALACATVATLVRDVYLPKDMADMAHDVVLQQCEADHWGDDARVCISRVEKAAELPGCFHQLTDEQYARNEAAFARSIAVFAAIAEPAAPAAAKLPEGCNRYAAAIERLARCPKLPPETQQALRDVFKETSESWSRLPPDALPAVNAACIAAADAVEQSAAACN